ncbi:MAG: DEAD/DEAH box helicase [Acidobacteriota bacterium]|nr:DEAD/DEAH box helicase [Acidobacteriota bacterium]
MHFKELNLHPDLLRAIEERGYEELTAVQEQTLAETLQGRDAAVQSQTGTGKTAAFLITILEKKLRGRTAKGKSAVIIVPTRELAVQIEGEARSLGRHSGLTVGCFFGGVGYAGQLALLRKGVDIIIGTPGRLLDLSDKGCLKLKDAALLVIDEADRLFDMGFLPDIQKILQKMPPPAVRQSMLFSATLNRISRKIASGHMHNPAFIELTPEQLTVDTITQELYHVKSHIKVNLLLGILQNEKPRNALIFTNMRYEALRLAKKLALNGYRSRYLSGDLPQVKRMKVIDDFMSGKFSYLVATDVAARGLHIEDLEMVVNYDLPQDMENYVHRIGRTARAGKAGKAVSFACEKFGKHLEDIESFIGMKIAVQSADFEKFASDRSLEYELKEKRRRSREPHGARKGSRRGAGPGMRWETNPRPV